MSTRHGGGIDRPATDLGQPTAREATANAVMDGTPGPFSKLVDQEWQTLLDKDDRTSPEDYPDMCLLTRTELACAMTEAFLLGRDKPAQPHPEARTAEGEEETPAHAKPPPHWSPGPTRYMHPERAEQWDYRNDPVGGALDVSERRLSFNRDRADPRAPEEMTLVYRIDLMRVMGDWQHKRAYFKHNVEKTAALSNEVPPITPGMGPFTGEE